MPAAVDGPELDAAARTVGVTFDRGLGAGEPWIEIDRDRLGLFLALALGLALGRTAEALGPIVEGLRGRGVGIGGAVVEHVPAAVADDRIGVAVDLQHGDRRDWRAGLLARPPGATNTDHRR